MQVEVETVKKLLTEELLGIPEAARRCKTDPSTLSRWIHQGDHGVKLEAVFLGEWHTSAEALARFFAARTERRLMGSTNPAAREAGPAGMARRAEEAGRKLRERRRKATAPP